MPSPELIRAFLSQAKASGGRSTVLQPLGWLTATLILGMVLASACRAPPWSIALFGILLVGCVLLYLGSYIYFAVKSPDALRSEKFTLSKMALEKNLIGDNTSGLLEMEEPESLDKVAALPNLKENG
jgi:hypothetical protein